MASLEPHPSHVLLAKIDPNAEESALVDQALVSHKILENHEESFKTYDFDRIAEIVANHRTDSKMIVSPLSATSKDSKDSEHTSGTAADCDTATLKYVVQRISQVPFYTTTSGSKNHQGCTAYCCNQYQ